MAHAFGKNTTLPERRSPPVKYRPDIDGLRTIAVVPVILFHAGLGLTGGYVGVDVFFVISGFLITTILWTETREGRFSILRFYERRARRIFPALFAMAAVTAVFAWVLLLPPHLDDFGESLVATAVFLSNVYFYLKEGYFTEAAHLKPLLHTWSLAVEEQYYIVFPRSSGRSPGSAVPPASPRSSPCSRRCRWRSRPGPWRGIRSAPSTCRTAGRGSCSWARSSPSPWPRAG